MIHASSLLDRLATRESLAASAAACDISYGAAWVRSGLTKRTLFEDRFYSRLGEGGGANGCPSSPNSRLRLEACRPTIGQSSPMRQHCFRL